MKHRHAALGPGLAVTFALALAPSPLAGRQAATDSTAPIPIAPLTITVTRTPLALERAPFAVSVVDVGAARPGEPGLGLDEPLRGIPGVQVDNRYNYALGERISIRGFGARAQFGVRGLKVLVDGIPATLPDGQTALNHVDLGGLGRAEVLRGPASALYGNAAGGVIQLETAEPPAVGIRQEARFIGGDHGLLRLESRTGGRVDDVSYRIDLSRHAADGFRDHSAATSVRGGAVIGYRRGGDDLRISASYVDYEADNPGSLSAALLREDPTQAFASNKAQRTGETGEQAQLGARWRRALAGGELELSAYGLSRSIENPIPPTIIDLDRTAGGARALYRGRAPLGGRDLRWTAGLEADRQRDDRVNFANEQGSRGEVRLRQLEHVAGLGGFLQLAAPLADRVDLLGGFRYDRFDFQVEDRLIDAGNPDDSGERTLDALSPSLGIFLAVGPALGLHVNVGTAFQTPTTTELANRPEGSGGFNPGLEPERTLSFEAGARGRLGGGVSYQFAAYRATIDDALIGFEVPDAAGRTFFRNAGSAVHRGFEAEASALPLDAVEARLAYTYIDARFDDYRTADESFDGKRVPGIAPHRIEAELRYRPDGWFADLRTRYVTRMAVDDANTAYSPAYAVTELRLGATGRSIGGLEVAPFAGVDNLFDRRYNASVTINAFGGRYFEPGPGRAFYAGASLRFGTAAPGTGPAGN